MGFRRPDPEGPKHRVPQAGDGGGGVGTSRHVLPADIFCGPQPGCPCMFFTTKKAMRWKDHSRKQLGCTGVK